GLAELQPAMLQLARELGAFAAALRGLRHAAAVGMEGGIGHGAVDGRDLRLDVREAALDAGELPLDRPELRGQPGAVLGGGAALVPARAAAALGARGSAPGRCDGVTPGRCRPLAALEPGGIVVEVPV